MEVHLTLNEASSGSTSIVAVTELTAGERECVYHCIMVWGLTEVEDVQSSWCVHITLYMTIVISFLRTTLSSPQIMEPAIVADYSSCVPSSLDRTIM